MGMGKILSETLTEKGIKVSELSNKTGIPRTTLYSIIQRDSLKIDPNHLTTICNVLNVPVGLFISPPTSFDSPEDFDRARKKILTDQPQGVEYKTSKNVDGRYKNEVINHDRKRMAAALTDCVNSLSDEYLEALVAIAESLKGIQMKRNEGRAD